MERYVEQLLNDLRVSRETPPAEPDYERIIPDYDKAPDILLSVLKWEYAPSQTMEELFGLPPDAFPPPDKLTNDQQGRIVEGILALWDKWNIVPDIPAGVPTSLLYRCFREFWHNESIIWISEGSTHLEFCDYEPAHCCWGKTYCRCKND